MSTLEIVIKVQRTDGPSPSISSKTTLHVDGQQIGCVSRLRADVHSDEVLPHIEIDMLKGVTLDDLKPEAQARAKEHFELLRKCPGVVVRMPAPRDE